MEEQHMTGRMWFQLIEVRLRFIGLLILTGVLVGYWDTIVNYWQRFTRSATAPATIEQAQIEYFCPMHPNIIRAEMGNCPICGMPLSKRAKGVAAALPPEITGRLFLSPYRIAMAGVRTEQIKYRPLVREIETVGELVFDERKLARISARFPGRIDKLFVNFTGTGVKTGDPLAAIYSPALITTFEELLANQKGGHGLEGITDSIKKKLIFWGVEQDQIDQVLKTGVAPNHLMIRSPINGVVTKRSVVEGQYIEEGMNLFDLGNLNVVWVMSKVYEDDLALVKIGQDVTFDSVSYPGATFSGSIAYIDPVLERDTRTVNVRIDLENTAMKLRPGMYGTVRIQVPISSLPEFRGLVEPVGSGTKSVWWCPMHPEMVHDQPGECPKCGGMKLEEKKVAIQVEEKVFYSCPMHPDVVLDQPGKCAICKPYMDMDLEPHSTATMPLGIPAVPETAVIDTGNRQIVYVDVGGGLFDGRLVSLGRRAGIYFPILSGLKPGDNVVAHGSFLIDAETRLNPAAGATYVGAGGGPAKKSGEAPLPSTAQPQPSIPPSQPSGHQGHGG